MVLFSNLYCGLICIEAPLVARSYSQWWLWSQALNWCCNRAVHTVLLRFHKKLCHCAFCWVCFHRWPVRFHYLFTFHCNLSPPDMAEAAFYLCAYEFAINTVNSPWCRLFDEVDGQVWVIKYLCQLFFESMWVRLKRGWDRCLEVNDLKCLR